MAGRTYIPQIVRILGTVCRYIQRYSSQLSAHLTAPQYALLQAVLSACVAFTDSLDTPIINP